jgi:hypothetical protein
LSGKSGTKIWATFVFFQKLPKVNNRPLGENSPNLVTLHAARGQYSKQDFCAYGKVGAHGRREVGPCATIA